MRTFRRTRPRSCRSRRSLPTGFTLVELLIVIAIIGILVGMLLPTLARAKAKAHGVLCLNNTRQLTLAWTMYAGDNNDRLVANLIGDPRRGIVPESLDHNWVNNVMTWELDSGNTNTGFIAVSPLGSYLGQAIGPFKCPSDRALSAVQQRAGWTGRVRSYSMNAMVGDVGPSWQNWRNINNPSYRQYVKLYHLDQPAGIFVLVDEHPDSISDGYFLNKGDDSEWLHLPASYHSGAASFSFADGHVEAHRWRLPGTQQPARPDILQLPLPVPAGERTDLEWILARTSVEHP